MRHDPVADLPGISAAIRRAAEHIRFIAPHDCTVTLVGESGTGKELAARAIHALSPRARGPFIAVSAAELAEGLVQSQLFGHRKGSFTSAVRDWPGLLGLADGGTLLLDEFHRLRGWALTALLRFLDGYGIRAMGSGRTTAPDARVIVAMQPRPGRRGGVAAAVRWRLGCEIIEIPPLRERREDIPVLAARFMERGVAESLMIDPSTLALLDVCAWPGNVRQLKKAMEFAARRAEDGLVLPRHLPPGLDEGPTRANGKWRREALAEVLRATGGNKAEAARRLGRSDKTVRRWIKEGR